MPLSSFLGLVIFSARPCSIAHYATLERDWGPTPLEDQAMAGGIMWAGGDAAFVLALVLTVAAWLRHEEREARMPLRTPACARATRCGRDWAVPDRAMRSRPHGGAARLARLAPVPRSARTRPVTRAPACGTQSARSLDVASRPRPVRSTEARPPPATLDGRRRASMGPTVVPPQLGRTTPGDRPVASVSAASSSQLGDDQAVAVGL